MSHVEFRTSPARYRHWRLAVDGPVATLAMDVDERGGLVPGYELKLNSYDLGVDVELYDATQRLRFEHPEVKAVVMTSGKEKIFCAGANIRMLAASAHSWKVNFCKFTNETRNGIEDATENSGQAYLAALNGTASGGGYELALACDRILLVDDRSSVVSLPELPLLGVLPGTGGLTRVVDKRHVRRDLADYFSTKSEGIGGKKAVAWKLVDEVVPRVRWQEVIEERARDSAAASTRLPGGPAISLTELGKTRTADSVSYKHVSAALDAGRAVAEITVTGPPSEAPASMDAVYAQGAAFWPLAVARELDDLILDLRTNETEIGTWVLRTAGDAARVLACDELLLAHYDSDWLAREIVLFWKRTLKRLDVTSRSLIALIEPGSCFAGSLLELALAADRSYMLSGVFEDVPSNTGDPDAAPAAVTVGPMNLGPLPMGNGLTRLVTRFLGDADGLAAVEKAAGSPLEAADAEKLGLVTFAPDDIDWEEEVRIAVEERASFSPDALTGLEANYRFAGPETVETKIFGRLTAWQNWIFYRPNASGPDGALRAYGTGKRADFDRKRVLSLMTRPDYTEKIPNNVGLAEDRRLQRALESWQPDFLSWWESMGPALPTQDVYLRTAIDVRGEGWATFGHVPMIDYRWGIFLADKNADRRIAFGAHKGEPAWQKVPGEYRAELQRLIVIQGDTEPASVEQQRNLGATAPSLYDLRNLFQVNVEEGRHLWAMVYLLHAYFGREGREEAAELLHRNSGSQDSPRILGAFNEETPDWLSFFMFTYFTDRDGKYQLGTLKESAFDPLSRTCEFMLKEEAHHMMVGTTGVDRVVERTAQVMVENDTDDVAALGVIPLPVIQKYLNFHYSVSLDLFGGETSTNVANYYTAGLKGRWLEERRKDDHQLTNDSIMVDALVDGEISQTEVMALTGLNTDLRREYIADCSGGVKRWNRILEEAGLPQRLYLPHVAFNRRVGAFAPIEASPTGERLTASEWEARKGQWLPTDTDKTFVRSLMRPVYERGKIAAWVAPPRNGINGQPFDYDYVHLA